jgi:hypothetical protein
MRYLVRIALLSATLAAAALAAATGSSSSRAATVKVAFLQGEQVVPQRLHAAPGDRRFAHRPFRGGGAA